MTGAIASRRHEGLNEFVEHPLRAVEVTLLAQLRFPSAAQSASLFVAYAATSVQEGVLLRGRDLDSPYSWSTAAILQACASFALVHIKSRRA